MKLHGSKKCYICYYINSLRNKLSKIVVIHYKECFVLFVWYCVFYYAHSPSKTVLVVSNYQ